MEPEVTQPSEQFIRQRILRLETVLIPQAEVMREVWIPETLARFRAELNELKTLLTQKE